MAHQHLAAGKAALLRQSRQLYRTYANDMIVAYAPLIAQAEDPIQIEAAIQLPKS
jgi:hypothetical protein